ncbi:MAG: hypothetical protein GXY83_32685 [Rhodopirellula sp.]|nr:hypothetical protein [Rhodopirellula sp.]
MTKSSSVAAESVSGKRLARKPASAGAAARVKQPVGALAQRRAAAILEVLAGVCTPPEAAAVLGISVNGYYLLERKALAGLTSACEPKPKGRVGPGPEQKLAAQQREVERLRRECLRQAALVRATQRAVGLPAAAPPTEATTSPASGAAGATGRRAVRPRVCDARDPAGGSGAVFGHLTADPAATKIRCYDPDGPPLDLPARVKDGTLRCTLPELRIYRVLSVSPQE